FSRHAAEYGYENTERAEQSVAHLPEHGAGGDVRIPGADRGCAMELVLDAGAFSADRREAVTRGRPADPRPTLKSTTRGALAPPHAHELDVVQRRKRRSNRRNRAAARGPSSVGRL